MYFNSRPHEEVDEKEFFARNSERKFQLTTSRRGRPKSSVRDAEKLIISTHDLTKRSTSFNFNLFTKTKFQLTTSRRGRLKNPGVKVETKLISTHDLTKRSTLFSLRSDGLYPISTHDLTKRSTDLIQSSLVMESISTHDLTKRSTMEQYQKSFIMEHFNSRPHEEVDRSQLEADQLLWSISTHDLTKRSTPL